MSLAWLDVAKAPLVTVSVLNVPLAALVDGAKVTLVAWVPSCFGVLLRC